MHGEDALGAGGVGWFGGWVVGDLGGCECADGCGGCGGRWGLRGRELECGVMVVCVSVLSALNFVTRVYLRGSTVR